jgi:carbonic anhydrase
MSSPTARSLKVMRERGYLADVVEKWIPGANIRKDLYGFIDILCIKDNEIVGVQSTSGDNVAARCTKIAEHPNVDAVRKAGIKLVVHGWRKNSKNRWVLREVDVS